LPAKYLPKSAFLGLPGVAPGERFWHGRRRFEATLWAGKAFAISADRFAVKKAWGYIKDLRQIQ
jgi:hypothetical protein